MNINIEITEQGDVVHFFRAITEHDGAYTAVESNKFDPSIKEARRMALDIFFGNLTFAMRRRLFPEDTQIADFKTLENGQTILTNLRYPDDKE